MTAHPEPAAPQVSETALVDVGDLDRATYIGGSRVAAILGLDAYGKTPLSEYLAITGQVDTQIDPKTLAFFEWRKEWEPIVIKRVKREFDAHIVRVNQRYRDPEYDFLAAEIDAEWADENGEIQNLEIKTVHPLAFGEKGGWGDAGTDEVPINYAAQCQWGLMVTGRQVCVLVAMAGIDTFVFYRIVRDDELIAEMRERCVRFWTENVLAGVPPEPVTLEDVMRLTLRANGRPVQADDDLFEAIRAVRGIRESIKAMDAEKDDLMFKIGLAVWKQWKADPENPPKDSALILRGKTPIATWNLQRTTRLDAKALREAEPDVAAKYSKTTPSRVLRIKPM